MAVYRPFFIGFWSDPDIEPFKPEEKLVYAFLFTNDRTTESGIYTISEKNIHERTGVILSKINDILMTLQNTYKKITRDGNAIFIHGFFRRNSRGNPSKIELSILRDMENTPSVVCWMKFLDVYKNHRICSKIKEVLNTWQSVGDTSLGIGIGLGLREEGMQGEKQDAVQVDPQASPSKEQQIYAIYPRKVGHKAALDKIKAALKKVDFEILFQKVKSYAESVKGKELKYIPLPATWFYQERWNDPIEKSTTFQIKNPEQKKNNYTPAPELSDEEFKANTAAAEKTAQELIKKTKPVTEGVTV